MAVALNPIYTRTSALVLTVLGLALSGCPPHPVLAHYDQMLTVSGPTTRACLIAALEATTGHVAEPRDGSRSPSSKGRTKFKDRADAFVDLDDTRSATTLELVISLPVGERPQSELDSAWAEIEDLRKSIARECKVTLAIKSCDHKDGVKTMPCPPAIP